MSLIHVNQNFQDNLPKNKGTMESPGIIKSKIRRYRVMSVGIILGTCLCLYFIFQNVSPKDTLMLALPLLFTSFFAYKTAEDVYKEKAKSWNIISVIAALWISLCGAFITKSSSNEQSLKTRAERDSLQKISDSTISRKVTDSVRKIYDGISNSFAKQGLKLDSLTYVVSKFRDSAKTIIMNSQVKDPLLNIYNNRFTVAKETSEELVFKVGVTCEEESAKDIKLNYIAEIDYAIGTDSYQADPINLDRMSAGQTVATDIPLATRIGTIKTVTFLFYGKCRSSYQNSKEIKLDPILYIYKMETKWATRYTGETKRNYIAKYKAKGYDL